MIYSSNFATLSNCNHYLVSTITNLNTVHMSSNDTKSCDLVVVGAGPVGSCLALLADSYGFNTVLIDAREHDELPQNDIRNLALVLGSWRLLETLDIADELAPHSQPLNGLEAIDGGKHFFGTPKVKISNSDLNLDNCTLGYMVEAHRLEATLDKFVQSNSRINVIRPARFESMSSSHSHMQVVLNNGMSIQANLVIACDGANSAVRKSTGIRTEGHEYGKSVVSTNVSLSEDHQGIARQMFTSEGPFATLPLQGNKANIAWYVRTETAEALVQLKKQEFEAELNGRFSSFAGYMQVVSSVVTFPLRMQIAERMIDERVALVGEAARTINPLAGQGLNLGFKDVAALIEVLVDARRIGLDIGFFSVLERYQNWRRADSNATALALDSIDWMFTNQLPPTKLVRGLAFSTINRSKLLRRILARSASSALSGLPRLLKGEILAGT